MARKGKCLVCEREDVEEINKKLIANHAVLPLSKEIGVSEPTLRRHKHDHLPDVIARAVFDSISDENGISSFSEVVRTVASAAGSVKEAADLHREDCKQSLIKASAVSPINDLAFHVELVHREALGVLYRAKEKLDDSTVLKALREARGGLELVMRASELFSSRQGSRELEETLEMVIDELHDFPEVRSRISEKLYKADIKRS